MSTRATNARHVRQRKLNSKQPLQITRENQIDETLDDESQRNIPQVESGVEKGEEIEFHLQAVISAASAAARGIKTQENYIPTPEATKAKGIDLNQLYPRTFKEPATYIRFSSTVEECVGAPYCMNEQDAEFLANLNDGKDVNGQPLKDKGGQCSEDTFEEVMSFFEETSQRVQPYANVDSPPLLSLEEMEQAREDFISAEAQKNLKAIYLYWVLKKGTRPLMPSIKVRMLDTTSEADDADPYVCFRRREVRQTRKTRGRDAQVVEKLKKLRLELEQARELVQMVRTREELNKQNLEISRKVFDQRRQLKEVKIAKNIIGEKGEDEELLINQKPVPKPKARQEGGQRPTTIRLRSITDQRPPENDLVALSDLQAEAESHVTHTIDSRKEQHKRWNHHWQDRTWDPITPPPEVVDQPRWAPLFPEKSQLPTPPPSLPSRSSQDRDGDVEMQDQPTIIPEEDKKIAPALEEDDRPEPDRHPFTFFVPPPYPLDGFSNSVPDNSIKRDGNPACRLRYGRGGRCHLEMRKTRDRGAVKKAVVSDSESDDEAEDYFPVLEPIMFDYRCALNSRVRPDGMTGERRQWPSGDQTAMMIGAQQAAAAAAAAAQQTPGQSQQQSVAAAGVS